MQFHFCFIISPSPIYSDICPKNQKNRALSHNTHGTTTGYNSDIICLQEVDKKVFEGDLLPRLSSLGFFGLLRLEEEGRLVGLLLLLIPYYYYYCYYYFYYYYYFFNNYNFFFFLLLSSLLFFVLFFFFSLLLFIFRLKSGEMAEGCATFVRESKFTCVFHCIPLTFHCILMYSHYISFYFIVLLNFIVFVCIPLTFYCIRMYSLYISFFTFFCIVFLLISVVSCQFHFIVFTFCF